MRSLRYLNTVLTVIAVLLALHLWTLWIGGPWVPSAVAAGRAPGLGNASTQRRQMVDELKKLSAKTDELTGLFRSGRARVKVHAPKKTNPARAPRP